MDDKLIQDLMAEVGRLRAIERRLLVWVDDTASADAIDEEHSYTHASCGYSSAQDDVRGMLEGDQIIVEGELL